MRRAILLLILMCLALPLRAADGNGVIASVMEKPQQRGEVIFRWLGLPLYTARLFTPGGQAFSWSRPMALQLVYARRISRQRLVDATVSELERIEGAQPDHAAIGQKISPCFRDVDTGDQFIATSTAPGEVWLFFNGTATCRVTHQDLGSRFLAIWLSEKSRSPSLSRQLRGGQ